MLKYIIASIFFMTCFSSSSFGQVIQEIKVPLKTKIGSGPFNKEFLVTYLNMDSTIHFNGIPGDLTEKIIKVVNFEPQQRAYELYLNGVIKKNLLMRLLSSYYADTLQLSKLPIKQQIFFLVGTNAEGKRVVIADANNDRDFSDDKVFKFDTSLSKKKEKIAEDLPSSAEVHFQYYSNHKILNKTLNIIVYPIRGEMKYKNPIEEKLYLMVELNEHREGIFSFHNQKFKVQITSEPPWAVYNNKNTLIRISNIDKTYQGEAKQSNSYMIGDTISLNGLRYQFSGISFSGDTLNFSYIGRGPVVYGNDSGKIAYNIKMLDLFNREFDLSNLKGEYVLLDFWGTWCLPCIKGIPYLRDVSEKFKNKVQIVSIDVDQLSNIRMLRKMVKSNKMTWINIFQNERDDSQQSVINRYRIREFPTEILINPQGRIIFRMVGGDGFQQVIKKLNMLIQF